MPVALPSIAASNASSSGASGHRVIRRTSLNTIDTFTSFSPSVLDLPNILTSRDFETTVSTYSKVILKAQVLQKALDEVSRATSEFGQALEDSINENPKIQNPRSVREGINNAGGLQILISTNQQILGRLIGENFEKPLRSELEKLKYEYQQNHIYYQQEIRSRSKILREQELKNIKLSKLKTRNISEYKNNLVELTKQVEEIDRLKYGYYHEINLMLEKFNQDQLLTRTGSLVRAQLEIYEGIAKKGWSGGGLDDLLSVSPDLFTQDSDFRDQAIQEEEESELERLEGRESEREDEDTELAEGDRTFQYEVDAVDTSSVTDSPKPENPLEESSPRVIDRSMDESFLLPVVNNSNSLLGIRHSQADKNEQEFLEQDQLQEEEEGEEEEDDHLKHKDNLLGEI